MKKYLLLCFALTACALFCNAESQTPTGRLNLKVAVINYSPILENQDNQPYWKACGWTDPKEIVPMVIEGWKKATDGMVQMEVVYWKNLDIFPYMGGENQFGQRRYTDETYWQAYTSRWNGAIDAKLANPGYAMTLTNDCPEIIPMVERGEVDHVLMFGGPYFGYWETIMVGKGAYWCNSSPLHLTNERIFVINGMNTERPGNGLHNYGHGLGESGIGAWFFNDRLGYDNRKTPATNANDFVLFTRCAKFTGENGQPIHCGNTHFVPNSHKDYDYNNPSNVLCSADQWREYPNLTAKPRIMNNSDWAEGRKWKGKIAADDETYQSWWWNHIPRKMGIHRGHICNWITYSLNPWHASWPIGSDYPCVQNDVDLRGWCSYQIYVPPGTTSVLIHATAGAPVYFGLRKDFVPYGNRIGGEESIAADIWDGKQKAFTVELTPENATGKKLEGYWYVTLGGGEESWESNKTYTTKIECQLRPRPVARTPQISVTAPTKDAPCTAGSEVAVTWQTKDIPQGIRGTRIAWRSTPKENWTPICEDYNYQLSSPYAWTVPTAKTTNAQIRIEIEDVYGATYSHTSPQFSIQ